MMCRWPVTFSEEYTRIISGHHEIFFNRDRYTPPPQPLHTDVGLRRLVTVCKYNLSTRARNKYIIKRYENRFFFRTRSSFTLHRYERIKIRQKLYVFFFFL